MKAILQGISAISIFVFAMAADGLMETYGLRKFVIISLFLLIVCAGMVWASGRFEDGE